MKRPLAVFGFTLFGALLCLSISESKALASCGLFASVILFLIFILIKKTRQSALVPVFLSALVAGCLLFMLFEINYENKMLLCGENVKVEAAVCESPYFSEENFRSYCYVRLITVGGEKTRAKMRLSFSQTFDGIDRDSLVIGDRLSFNATVYPLGSFYGRYLNYFKSHNAYFGAYGIENLTLTERENRSFSYYIDLMRDYVEKCFSHDFDNSTASVLIAILTGEKTFMESELYDSFKRSGVVHILAVSGMHLSIWINLLGYYISFKGVKGKVGGIFLILFVIFMMNFASFTGSVRRAGVMSLLYIAGKMLGKESDSLNNLGFACICVLFANPYAVYDVSFLLSVTATASIHIFALPLSKKLLYYLPMKLKRGVVGSAVKAVTLTFLISIGVMIFTLPVCVWYFGGVSLASPFTNVLLFFVLAPLLVLTGAYTVLRFVPFASSAVAVVLKTLCGYIISVCTKVSSFEYSYIEIEQGKTAALSLLLLAGFGIFLTVKLLIKKRNKKLF